MELAPPNMMERPGAGRLQEPELPPKGQIWRVGCSQTLTLDSSGNVLGKYYRKRFTMTSRFVDTHTRMADDQRCKQIADYKANEINRQFAPIKAKATANAKYMSQQKGWLAIA